MVHIRGRDCSNHDGLGVSAETVLQQPSEGRISVGNMFRGGGTVLVTAGFGESRYHGSQSYQTFTIKIFILGKIPVKVKVATYLI